MTINNKHVQNVLDSLILVSLAEIHGISGRAKLARTDLGKNAELPPEVIVSLGTKKIIDPKLLSPLTNCKTKAHSLCSNVGVKFLGGYAVPAHRVNELITDLNDLKTEFYERKRRFLQADFNSWIERCDVKFRDILRSSAKIDTDYMDKQIQFDFSAIHITPFGHSVIEAGITNDVISLTDEVFSDVADTVNGFLKNVNQTSMTQHTLNPLRRVAEKIDSLCFISDDIRKLAVYMTDVMSDVPDTGKITGKKYAEVLSLLNNLSNPSSAKNFVNVLNSTNPVKDSDIDEHTAITAQNPVESTVSNVPSSTDEETPFNALDLVEDVSKSPKDITDNVPQSMTDNDEVQNPPLEQQAPIGDEHHAEVNKEQTESLDDGLATDFPPVGISVSEPSENTSNQNHVDESPIQAENAQVETTLAMEDEKESSVAFPDAIEVDDSLLDSINRDSSASKPASSQNESPFASQEVISDDSAIFMF